MWVLAGDLFDMGLVTRVIPWPGEVVLETDSTLAQSFAERLSSSGGEECHWGENIEILGLRTLSLLYRNKLLCK